MNLRDILHKEASFFKTMLLPTSTIIYFRVALAVRNCKLTFVEYST